MKLGKKILIIALLPFLIGCNNGGDRHVDPVPVTPSGPIEKTDTVFVGLLDKQSYDPSPKTDFTITVDDTTIVTYDKTTKTITSYLKTGSTTIHFKSDKLIYTVSVTVKDDGTVPSLSLDDDDVITRKNKEYVVTADLTYRYQDVFDKCDGLHYTKDVDNGATTLTVEGKKITITGVNAGIDEYSVFTTVFSHTVSRLLKVTVIDGEPLIVIGKRMTITETGPSYNISMYKYSDNPINIKNDLNITKGDSIISLEDTVVSIDDTTIVSLTNNVLNPLKTGNTILNIEYQGSTSKINIAVSKPVIGTETVDIPVAEKNFNLEMNIDISTGTRQYSPNDSIKKAITIDPKGSVFSNVYSVKIGNKQEVVKPIGTTYNNSIISLGSNLFDQNVYGNQKIVVTLEGDTFFVTYEFELFVITKTIRNVLDFKSSVVMLQKDEVITGYYMLGNDIDFSNGSSYQEYVSDAAKETVGFRGILDGNNYKLKNIKATAYGLMITIGKGAVIKNITLDNLYSRAIITDTHGNESSASAIGRFIMGASFINVTINLDPTSPTGTTGPKGDEKGVGIISTQKVENCYFENLIINAPGLTLGSICGKNGSNTTFKDCEIHCHECNLVCTNPAKLVSETEGIEVIVE